MYLYTDPMQKTAVGTNGVLALVDGQLREPDDVLGILQAASESGAASLTIVGGGFSDAVIGLLVANSRQGDVAKETKKNGKGESKKPVIIAARPKDVGDTRQAVFDDLAALTGAEVLGRAWSRSAAQALPSDLGRVQRSEVTLERMLVLPENRLTPEARRRSDDLQARLARMTLDDEDRPLVVQRLAMLNGGMGLLKIGTESKLEREVQAQNAERALRVLSAAQHTGVVPGGGAAYLHCMAALDDIDAPEDMRFGVQLVQHGLVAPLRQILENAHVPSSSVIIDRVLRAGPGATYDVMSERVADAHEVGVLDVAGVLATVLQTAASAAMMALTTDTIVYHKNPKQAMTP